MDTTGVFRYQRPAGKEPHGGDGGKAALMAAAALEPVLLRWRHRCSQGLIDDSGKIRNVFRRAEGVGDNVGQLIEELNRIPEALAELETVLDARLKLEDQSRLKADMPVHDARLLETTSLHGNGFQLVRHRSRVTDWDDDDQLNSVYFAEICSVVKEVTGATHTFSSNHLRRQSEPPVGGNGPLARLMSESRGPVSDVHNDFTESYGEGIIRTVESGGVPHTQTFGITDAILKAGVSAQQLRESRMLVVNTWRAVTAEPVQRCPLAVADRNTIPRASLRSILIGKTPSGQPRGGIDIYNASYDPQHQWYYYPAMTRDEVLMWKGYDSAEVPARPNLHSAFDDPNTPEHAAERKSIEVRVLCLLPHPES